MSNRIIAEFYFLNYTFINFLLFIKINMFYLYNKKNNARFHRRVVTKYAFELLLARRIKF